MIDKLEVHEYVIHCQRKIKQKCQICNSTFKFGNAEHICKRCCRSVCSDCSPFKVKCYMADFKNQMHRMCRKCNIQSEMLHKYVKHNRLKWGEDSDLVKLWLRQLGLKSIPKKRNSQKKKPKQYIKFMQVWKSLNFSFRQFIGIVIDQTKINQSEIAQMINVCLTQLSTNKLMDLQHAIYILMFFLAHSNLNNAVYFTTIVVQICYAEELSMENFYFYLQQMHCTQIQAYKMESIIEETFEKMAKRCTVNVFTAEVTLQIMSQLICKREFEELEKGISFVFSQRKQFICQNANKPQDVFLDILRNAQVKNYRKIIKQLDGESSHSQKSDSQSNRSSPNRSSNNSKRQNEELRRKLSQQQIQLEQLRKQVTQYRSQAQIKQAQKNTIQANMFAKSAGQMSLMKGKTREKNDQSTSEENDEANYSNVIHKKNEQIIKLKKQLQSIKQLLKQARLESKGTDSERETGTIQKKMLRQKQDQIQKLKQQTESLKSTNKRLFIKLNQLTNLLMDKQQKNMKEANKFFDELPQQSNSDLTKQKLKQCKMY